MTSSAKTPFRKRCRTRIRKPSNGKTCPPRWSIRSWMWVKWIVSLEKSKSSPWRTVKEWPVEYEALGSNSAKGLSRSISQTIWWGSKKKRNNRGLGVRTQNFPIQSGLGNIFGHLTLWSGGFGNERGARRSRARRDWKNLPYGACAFNYSLIGVEGWRS